MRISFKDKSIKILRRLRLWPLSLEEKCRIAFGAAVALVLVVALCIPYVWMGQLTKKWLLDVCKAKAETILYRHHFVVPDLGEGALRALDSGGGVLDPNDSELIWISFKKDSSELLLSLPDNLREMVDSLKSDEEHNECVILEKREDLHYSSYVKVFRATEKCVGCHQAESTASVFSLNEPIGAAVVQRRAPEISWTVLLNRVWIVTAGLIGGVGAIATFYAITQRVILRPVRQLRALVNNVAEGNLDIRSSIKTGDDYEKLAHAFNHMLDNLQSAQEKLRQANIQLDGKISELSGRNIELFKANKVKGEFLANISHEFRTPLNAILGFAEIIREKPGLLKRDKGRRYAENIITGGNRLLNMINDLLNMAKTEAGKMELHIERTGVGELCKMVVGHFSGLTSGKKIKVKLSVEEKLPELVTDAGKVEQILYNFLSNAVNFTPLRGRIEIRASRSDDKTLRISVTDSGCGIAETDQEKIFEKFRQVDGSLTRQSTGTGLGLSISKELAGLLAGDIGMESKVGEGSTFWLEIPFTLGKEEK
ncbi:MAG: sensor histidine kinase [Planctomycetota bacterium]|jgi:signal transduction histidine kinase